MAQWKFYYSGILYSKISEEKDGLFIKQLDFSTGEFKDTVPFTQEENKVFWTLCKRDVLTFLQNKEKYEVFIKGEPEGFVTEDGEEYTNRRGASYIQRPTMKWKMGMIPSHGLLRRSGVTAMWE